MKPQELRQEQFTFKITPDEAGVRLDKFITRQFSELSRSFLGKLIKQQFIQVDGLPVKAGHKLHAGERIEVTLPPPADSELVPKEISLSIIHEDRSILVLSKPPSLVVHPGAGNEDDTLIHGLLHHCGNLPGLESHRPGIVHRLDKDTSGIMLIAKNETALRKLSDDFKQRNLKKQYHALLLRSPRDETGRIVAPLGRHPVNRKKMAVRPQDGRYAATGWQILETFDNGMCWARIDLETGRTHQIRVHMSSLGCPVAGDVLYGGAVPDSFGLEIPRQFLHAATLEFIHPDSNETVCFSAPLWPDIQATLDRLRCGR